MAASQPLNSDIKVYRTLRGQRVLRKYDTVEAITKRLRSLVGMVPGKELLTQVETRDTSRKDFSAYASSGQPVVIGAKSDVEFSSFQGIDSADYAFQIGQDKFIRQTEAGLSDDLFAAAQAL